jgi:hypothetical protein
MIEVMVALVIAGVVVSGAYAMAGATADARARTERERAEAFPGPAAREALDGWLRAAALLEGAGPFQGLDRADGPFPRDALAFVVEDGGALHPGPRRVRLWVERDPRGGRAGLLAELAPLRLDDRGGVDTLLVAPDAVGLEARYRTRVGREDQWVGAWSSATMLPDAVELTVVPPPESAANENAGRRFPRVLRLPLVAPLRSNPDASDDRSTDRSQGLRAGCGAVGAGADVCAGG